MSPRPTAPGPADPDAYAALEEQRDFLLGSLDDLEREKAAGDIDDVDYEALKDDYTARAAAVLRALDDGGARFASARRPGSWRFVALVVSGVLLVAAGAGFLLARSSGTRAGNESITWDIRLDTREELARCLDLFSQQEVLEAVQCYDAVLESDPENVEALTYRGWALIQSTLVDEGLTYLEQAIEVDPAYPDAHVFRAITLRNLDRLDEARAELAALDDLQLPVAMEGLIAGLREDLAVDGAATIPTTTAG